MSQLTELANFPKIREKQFLPAQIRQITAGNPEVWQGKSATEESQKSSQAAFEKMANFLKENSSDPKLQNLDVEKIKTLRQEFEEMYKNQANFNNKNLENVFHQLIIATLRHEMSLQMKIWKIPLTQKETEEINKFSIKKSAHISYQITNGRLEETCFAPWIADKLPTIEKFKQAEFDQKSDQEKAIVMEYYRNHAYQNAVKMINAHFFGVIKTPQEIEKLIPKRVKSSK